MPKDKAKMKSWQIWHYARKYLGRSILYGIVGTKNARAVDYWCQNPRYTDKPDHASDPILWVKKLIDTLDDDGHCHVVRSLQSYLFGDADGCCGMGPDVRELLPTLVEEMLADYRPVADLHNAIEEGQDINVVNDLKFAAIEELHRTVAKYIVDSAR